MGFAITYQCVQTICQIYPNNSLLEKGSKIISNFFKIEQSAKINSSNLKYLGIEAMRSLVKINPAYAQ
jgi:AP-4 complex subunit epsilon-1